MDGVVDGPALAERSTQVPVAAVFVALEREEPLPGADQQQRPCHFLLTSGRLLVQTDPEPESHRSRFNSRSARKTASLNVG